MFAPEVYMNRRRSLLEKMAAMTQEGARGIAVFLGNVDAPTNYRGNDYKFRQDSNFLYFWGIDEPCFAAVLDLDSADECLYGNDVDIEVVNDMTLGAEDCIIETESGVFNCGIDMELSNLEKDIRSLCS